MKIEERERSVVVRIEDDILFDKVEEFERTIQSALERGKRCIVIDFAGIDYLASQCLKTISCAVNAMKESGGELVIVNPTERVRALCRLTRLDVAIRILDREEDAAPAGPEPGDRGRC